MDRIEVFLVVIAWELAAIVLTTAEGTGFVLLPPLFLLFVLPIYLLGMLFVDSVSQQTLIRLIRLR